MVRLVFLWEYLANEVGGGEEAFGAPKGIVEVSAMAFKLRRQTAVDDGSSARPTEEISYQWRRRRHFDAANETLKLR